MRAKEILIQICDLKFSEIRKRSDIELWTEDDRRDLLSWDSNDINQILSRMGPSNCPWCIKTQGDCTSCSYGKRHGICRHAQSDYRKAETDRKQKDLSYLSKDVRSNIEAMLKEYQQCQ